MNGHSIPQQTWGSNAPGGSATVPMLIGNDKDESTPRNESLFKHGRGESLVRAGRW